MKETTMHGSTPTDGFNPPPGGVVNIPTVIPIFPLPKVVLLPGEVLPLHIFEPRYRVMMQDALNQHRVIGMVEYDPSSDDSSAPSPPVRNVGCAGYIAEHKELPDGRYLLWLLGLERFKIDEELETDALYRRVRVTYTPTHESAEALAGMHPLRSELRQMLPQLVELDEESRDQLRTQIREVSDSQLIALACQILELPSPRKRQILEADNQVERFLLVYEDLYRHLDGSPEMDDLPQDELN
jgi:Lon protease-like protein